MSAETEIGRCKCPVCRKNIGHLRVSKKQLAYVVCNGCHSQTMARSDVSDGHLRQDFQFAAPAPEPEPAPQPTPAAPVPPAPPAPKRGTGWGFAREQ